MWLDMGEEETVATFPNIGTENIYIRIAERKEWLEFSCILAMISQF
jgi:hypothetical protein